MVFRRKCDTKKYYEGLHNIAEILQSDGKKLSILNPSDTNSL